MKKYTKKTYETGLVSEITILPVQSKKTPTLRARVNFVIAKAFKGYIAYVIEGKNGLFVTFKSMKNEVGQWYEMVHPITAEARTEFHDKVLEAYAESLKA